MKMQFYILSTRAFSCSHFRGRINTSANQGYFDSYFPSHSKVVALCYPDEGKATFADVDLDEQCTQHR